MGKLQKADKKDTEDQRAFELLEEAVLDSSFCSTSVCFKEISAFSCNYDIFALTLSRGKLLWA